MQTSLTGTRARLASESRACNAGFTIIELLVVLAIIAIMSGVVVVSMAPALRDAKMRSACRMIASLVNYARSTAVATNAATRVVFEEGKRAGVQVPVGNSSTGAPAAREEQWVQVTTSAGVVRSLPEGISITRMTKASASIEAEDEQDRLEFTKLGETDAAIIELSDADGNKKFIIVDPLTGRCRIETSEGVQRYFSNS